MAVCGFIAYTNGKKPPNFLYNSCLIIREIKRMKKYIFSFIAMFLLTTVAYSQPDPFSCYDDSDPCAIQNYTEEHKTLEIPLPVTFGCPDCRLIINYSFRLNVSPGQPCPVTPDYYLQVQDILVYGDCFTQNGCGYLDRSDPDWIKLLFQIGMTSLTRELEDRHQIDLYPDVEGDCIEVKNYSQNNCWRENTLTNGDVIIIPCSGVEDICCVSTLRQCKINGEIVWSLIENAQPLSDCPQDKIDGVDCFANCDWAEDSHMPKFSGTDKSELLNSSVIYNESGNSLILNSNYNGSTLCQVYDLEGNLHFETKIDKKSNEITIPLDDKLVNGRYFYVINTEDGKPTFGRFLIVK